jgi:hypothetical protein
MFSKDQVKIVLTNASSQIKTCQNDSLEAQFTPACLDQYDTIAKLYIDLYQAAESDELDIELEQEGTIELEAQLIRLLHLILCVQDDNKVLSYCDKIIRSC